MFKRFFDWVCGVDGQPVGEVVHQHDFDMEFIEGTLDYRLVCKCGATASDMDDALRRMGCF